jgi:hypothetical protein
VIALAVVSAACVAWVCVLRRRLARAADVEHELRGALTAMGLAVARRADAQLTAAYEGQLARVRAARGEGGGSRCSLERLVAGLTVPAGGAVVLGNLVANAVEHGEGPVAIRIEVANSVEPDRLNGYRPPDVDNRSTARALGVRRGRGLRIAARAARAAGGRLEVREEAGRFAAAVELPVEP